MRIRSLNSVKSPSIQFDGTRSTVNPSPARVSMTGSTYGCRRAGPVVAKVGKIRTSLPTRTSSRTAFNTEIEIEPIMGHRWFPILDRRIEEEEVTAEYQIEGLILEWKIRKRGVDETISM